MSSLTFSLLLLVLVIVGCLIVRGSVTGTKVVKTPYYPERQEPPAEDKWTSIGKRVIPKWVNIDSVHVNRYLGAAFEEYTYRYLEGKGYRREDYKTLRMSKMGPSYPYCARAFPCFRNYHNLSLGY
jgi:hypothetical protein